MVGSADLGRRSRLASGVRQFRFSFNEHVDATADSYERADDAAEQRQRLDRDDHDAQHE
jgi:hypothetical protein